MSIWWVVVAFWVGGCAGILLFALMSIAGKKYRTDGAKIRVNRHGVALNPFWRSS
jgi:hypothetical protein